MSNQSDRPLTPLIIAFVLVYAVAVMICGVLVDGTIALAFVSVAVMAVLATLIGVELFRHLGD
jgi:membrane protein YdbS with pleckstrin-like domain